MKATNYCAEYIEDSVGSHETLPTMVDFNVSQINKSVKFRLPDNGFILDVTNKSNLSVGDLPIIYGKYLDIVKLPYDRVAIEFLHHVESDGQQGNFKVILLARNSDRDDEALSFNFCIKGKHNNEWLWSGIVVFITDDFRLKVGRLGGSGGDFARDNQDITDDEQVWVLRFSNIILSMLSALACSNSSLIKQSAPIKLNKSRIKKGKQPFFSYKVLTIDTKADAKQQKGGIGTGNTKRVHLRRGHIRRLPDKTVWVNPCVVGDKSKGMVTKDYRVI